MNLEATSNLSSHTNQAAISASGNSYWQVTEPKVTAADVAAQAAVITRKTLTHKATIIIAAVLAALAVSLMTYVQIGNAKDRAYQAKIQRESRVVVL